jgi:hypothetical protein
MPLSPSALQSETSRRNGALSRGPVSEAGKAASAQNALRHGLRGGGISVRAEESAWYAGLLATHQDLYKPANAAEASLVEQLCLVELKLHRLDLLELAALDGAADGAAETRLGLPSLSTLARYRSRITKERWELEHRLSQLQQRRRAEGADAAGARAELRQQARARALGALAMMGALQSGVLTGGGARCTDEPEAAMEPHGTDAPELGRTPRNRRQRRMLARLARRNAAPEPAARAA